MLLDDKVSLEVHMSSITTTGLTPVTFNDLPAFDQNNGKLYDIKLAELQNLTSRSNELNYHLVIKTSLENFANAKLSNDEFEDKIFAVFTEKQEEEFNWRYACLLGKYKQLKELYNSSNNEVEKIKKLTKQIIKRQRQLCEWCNKLQEENKKTISWKKLYNKTVKYILDCDTRISLAKSLNDFKKGNGETEPHPQLRSEILTKAENSSKDTVFDESFESLQQVKSHPTGNPKHYYSFFSLVCFDEIKEKKIFEVLLEISKKCSPYAEIKFKSYCLFNFCNRLKMSENNSISADEISRLSELLHYLGENYSKGLLEKKIWDTRYNNIASLPLAMETKKNLLEIFLKYKKPDITPTSFYNLIINFPAYAKSWFWSTVEDGESRWKGDKYWTILKATQDWILEKKSWIEEQLDDKDNCPILKERVQNILEELKKGLPTLTEPSSLDQRKKYNKELRERSKKFLTQLREALSTKDYLLAFERYFSIGKQDVSGCVLILMELCYQRFTGINVVPFIAKLMEEMINIGLEQLACEETYYKFYQNREIFKCSLDTGTEIIHEAIAAVPAYYKSSLLAILGWKIRNVANFDWDPLKQGAFSMLFAHMTINNRVVRWLRFPTPTNSQGVNPEFRSFIGHEKKRVLLCSLQNSEEGAESIRTNHLFNLNSDHTFVTVFPVCNSALFNQEEKFADTKSGEPPFSTSVSFFQAIMANIIPDQQSHLNKPGNYLFPRSWFGSNQFKKMVEECLIQTNSIFFDGAQTLTPIQRRAFIKLFNVCLAFELIKYTNAEYFAFLCNHSADRTGVFVTLMLKILLIVFDRENVTIDGEPNSYTWHQIQEACIDGVPLVIAKREMNGFHPDLVKALDILKDPKVRERLIASKRIFGLTDFEFPFAKERDSNNNNMEANPQHSFQSFPWL